MKVSWRVTSVVNFIVFCIFVNPSQQCHEAEQTSQPTKTTHEITTTTKTTTTTETPGKFSCPSNWTMLTRISGPVCLKTFLQGALTQDGAEKKCQEQGATLSGIENTEEIKWLRDHLLEILPWNRVSMNAWVGMKKKKECETVNLLGAAPSCEPRTTNSMYWTDPTVTGTDGMVWWGNEPLGDGQSCALFYVQKMPDYGTNSYSHEPATLDDFTCNGHASVLAYVCAKAATRDLPIQEN